ncbi:MAG: CDP-alcohol phosphatidyltransferase family protein [Fulvivirga sp.]|uniref:CDP-alcohol phosphatidyltransferase family protein n=1 Tax=Fulvivirga sp. TaxID=1931237 RepID=UPI0032EB7A97
MKPYAYQCKDYSLLTPLFKKIFVEPVIGFIPWAIPANIITLISNSFFYVALYFSFDISLLGNATYYVIALLLLLYLIGDHLDGAQAKRTKTGSALGEFCDHYLDAFNNGILMLILFNLFAVTNPYLVALVLVTSYCAHVIVFYEQFKTGWLIFEKMGSLEGVILAIFIILGASISAVYNFYVSPILFGYSAMEILLVAISIGAVGTFVKTILRTPNVRYSIWMYVVIVSLIAYLGNYIFSVAELTTVITLYSSLYLGKIMQGHLIDGIERSPGLFTPLFLIIILGVPSLYEGNTLTVLIIYLVVSILLLIYRTFQSLGNYWVWTNPRLQNENS